MRNKGIILMNGAKKINYRKCMHFFEGELLRTKEEYAKSSVEKLKEIEAEKPLNMSDRDKAFFWMGINQGLNQASSMLQVAKDSSKEA